MAREVFGFVPESYQKRIMDAYSARKRRISVRSGHRVGKTTTLALIVIHHILTRFPQKTVCTAASQDQLFDALAAEVKAWITKLPHDLQVLLDVKAESIELKSAPNESFVSFRVSRADKPEAMAGVHSKNVLLIGDEASGIPDAIFESARGSMYSPNATMILAGNPLRSSGLFFDTHHALKHEWETFRISSEDASFIEKSEIESLRTQYGERSNRFRVRVLGEFPTADDDTVIPIELVEMALMRDVQPTLVRPIWGVDVGRFGDDPSCMAKRKGNVLLVKTEEWHGLDTMQLVGRVMDEWKSTPKHDQPEDICVDSIGIGAGVADRLRELGLPARGINVSELPAMRDRFLNLRAELTFKARDWFANRDCNISNDIDLKAELTGIRYLYQPNGKIKIESKDDYKKRNNGRSPNRADAFILTLASEAVTALGGAGQKSWATPIRRDIRSIV